MAESNENVPAQKLPLENQVAIVTGSSRGIGKAIALHLASLADDAVSQINSNKSMNNSAASAVAVAVKANISDPDEVKSLFDAAELAFQSPVNILVNSAAVCDEKHPTIMSTDLEDFDWTFSVNTRGSFLCCKEAANRMIKRLGGGGGRIICVTSSATVSFRAGNGAYTASKAAVEALVKILAKELKGTGITANCVAPGPIATDMFFDGATEEKVKKVIDECPHGRLGQSEDVAPVVGFLAGDASEWVNGQIIRVNGGYI
ncbi:hypothetical protein R3W88_022370 [Solanum pinnatisectum]|uniref:Short-chain type dehydrogenase/reductase n=1 Tax=Solanum pinnatisectum TaxID=50273 RepID=A0AAV9LUH2_9SOLN|nr:hypothetical protein R3W88_022370 [Solanum pinnatisectum]